MINSVCLSCSCCNGYQYNNYKKVNYYNKLYYNRKYHLEKYIKNIQIMKTLIIVLFNGIVNEILGLNLNRKILFKFNLILSKVFEILNYKIKMDNEITDNKVFNDIYEQIESIVIQSI